MRKQIMLTLGDGDHSLDKSLPFDVRPKEKKVLV
jgi:hypothetical protein